MADMTRVLFVAGEVTPFAKASELSAIVRKLPEQLQTEGDFESRIMMPRYGTISERRNRLHEVIRLSGSQITVGERTEELRVKVASIPGIRLQVYFMDNNHYFKRKGIHADKEGKLFKDNAERALFFAKSALETTNNLGWKPDVVHAFGWIAAFVPALLKTSYADHPLFESARSIYTPNPQDVESTVTERQLEAWGLPSDPEIAGQSINRAGLVHADAVALAGEQNGLPGEYFYLSGPEKELAEQAGELYAQVTADARVLA